MALNTKGKPFNPIKKESTNTCDDYYNGIPDIYNHIGYTEDYPDLRPYQKYIDNYKKTYKPNDVFSAVKSFISTSKMEENDKDFKDKLSELKNIKTKLDTIHNSYVECNRKQNENETRPRCN